MSEFLNKNELQSLINETIKSFIDEADFGANVKGDLTENDILQGEPVYHRPMNSTNADPLSIIKSLMKYGFSREYTGNNGGNMYGPGVYSVYSLKSSNEKATGYGSYIVKAYVLGGFKNFLIFNSDIAKKYYGKDWRIEDQIKLLMPPKLANEVLSRMRHKLYMNDNSSDEHIKTSIPAVAITDLLGSRIAQSKIRGIIYSGGHDGNCAFIRNFSDVIPYSYSKDNGRTWTKAITDELIWRAGHDTDVDATLKNSLDDKGKKNFDSTAKKAINGYVIVYKNNKANYFEVTTNKLISDVWFDYAGNFNEDGEAEVLYKNHKFTVYKEDDKFIVGDEYGCPICYLEDLPNENLNESVTSSGKLLSEAKNLVDNFDLCAKLLDINSDDDFHFVQIIKRKKDNPYDDTTQGNYHAGGWYLKSWRVHSADELYALKDEIIQMCEDNNARAYISINNRSEKSTNDYVKIYQSHYRPSDPRYAHAEEIVAGQAKDGPSWKGMRKRLFLDIDCPETETDFSGRNIWDEVRHMIDMVGIKPIAEYKTPSGGLHIILPDKEDKNYYYLKKLFAKFDAWKNKGKLATVHPNIDGKIILYSNTETKGY